MVRTNNKRELRLLKTKDFSILSISKKNYKVIVKSEIWVISSVGRAPRLQRECQRFESVIAHGEEKRSLRFF